MSLLEIRNIQKSYVPGESVIRGVDLEVNQGEIIVLLGSSGCGKTTLLKMIAGLEEQDAGTIVIDGVDMAGVRTEKRPIAMVFQKSLLFRNMTVEQNINFAPRVNRTMSKAEYQKRTNELLELIDMPGMGKKRVTELSGGQEQRVSLARALMTQPKVLLLDEPLSALDAKLRVSMRQHIRRLNRETGTTMVFVTHDQQEAVEMASRIALMHNGRILQYAPPQEFYTHPASYEVAEFFNWKNYVPATKVGSRVRCALGDFAFPLSKLPNGPCVLCVRPEAARVMREGEGAAILAGKRSGEAARTARMDTAAVFSSADADASRIAAPVLEGAVHDVIPLGPMSNVRVRVCGVDLEISVRSTDAAQVGEVLRFTLDSQMIWPVAVPEGVRFEGMETKIEIREAAEETPAFETLARTTSPETSFAIASSE